MSVQQSDRELVARQLRLAARFLADTDLDEGDAEGTALQRAWEWTRDPAWVWAVARDVLMQYYAADERNPFAADPFWLGPVGDVSLRVLLLCMAAARVESGCGFADREIKREKHLYEYWGPRGYMA